MTNLVSPESSEQGLWFFLKIFPGEGSGESRENYIVYNEKETLKTVPPAL